MISRRVAAATRQSNHPPGKESWRTRCGTVEFRENYLGVAYVRDHPTSRRSSHCAFVSSLCVFRQLHAITGNLSNALAAFLSCNHSLLFEHAGFNLTRLFTFFSTRVLVLWFAQNVGFRAESAPKKNQCLQGVREASSEHSGGKAEG